MVGLGCTLLTIITSECAHCLALQVYVADVGNHRIQVFSEDGSFRRFIGSEGEAPGEFRNPRGGPTPPPPPLWLHAQFWEGRDLTSGIGRCGMTLEGFGWEWKRLGEIGRGEVGLEEASEEVWWGWEWALVCSRFSLPLGCGVRIALPLICACVSAII